MINKIGNNFNLLNLSPNKSKKVPSFADFIKSYIQDVNSKQIEADKSIEKFIKGEKDITSTVLAVEKAEVSLQLFLQIRNKLVQAYQEIMRMQV